MRLLFWLNEVRKNFSKVERIDYARRLERIELAKQTIRRNLRRVKLHKLLLKRWELEAKIHTAKKNSFLITALPSHQRILQIGMRGGCQRIRLNFKILTFRRIAWNYWFYWILVRIFGLYICLSGILFVIVDRYGFEGVAIEFRCTAALISHIFTFKISTFSFRQ